MAEHGLPRYMSLAGLISTHTSMLLLPLNTHELSIQQAGAVIVCQIHGTAATFHCTTDLHYINRVKSTILLRDKKVFRRSSRIAMSETPAYHVRRQ